MQKNIRQKKLEKHFIDAFLETIIDYNEDSIELEEDFRAAMYYHLKKNIINNVKSLKIYLSHNLAFTQTTKKPDISIVRSNNYFICGELKIGTNHEGKLSEVNFNSAKQDIYRLKEFKEGFNCSYALRIQKNENSVIDQVENWMEDYLRELFYSINKKEISFFSIKKVIIKNKTTIKGGFIKIKLNDAIKAKNSGILLSSLIETKFKSKFKIDLF